MHGGHTHQRLLEGRALHAQTYPSRLCRVIVNAFERQLRSDSSEVSYVTKFDDGVFPDGGCDCDEVWFDCVEQSADSLASCPNGSGTITMCSGTDSCTKEAKYETGK